MKVVKGPKPWHMDGKQANRMMVLQQLDFKVRQRVEGRLCLVVLRPQAEVMVRQAAELPGAASVGDSVHHQQGDQGREVPGGRDPWVLEQFWHPPQRGSKDAWDLSLLPEGWFGASSSKEPETLVLTASPESASGTYKVGHGETYCEVFSYWSANGDIG